MTPARVVCMCVCVGGYVEGQGAAGLVLDLISGERHLLETVLEWGWSPGNTSLTADIL